ncbi:MAG: chemotaxis protein CheA [Candidatus Woesearchaeota archaeon]
MSKSSYKEAFLSEAREQLDNLNEGILNLEKEPENHEVVNQIFRSCHTLKGNSAMMGYQKFSELSHKMENVLGKVRDSEVSVNQDIIDKLFEGQDLLEEGLEAINNKDLDDINIDHLMEELNKITDSGEKVTHDTFNIKPRVELSEEQQGRVNSEQESGRNVFRVVVLFNPNNQLRGPKTQILMKKAQDYIESIIYSNPEFDKIQGGSIDLGFDIVISTMSSKEELVEAFDSVSDLKCHVLNLDEEFDVPESFLPQKSEPKKKDIVKTYSKPIQSIKVDVKKLDNLVNMVGELLISNMRLKQISKEFESTVMNDVINNIDGLTSEIQAEVMEQRMVPVGQIFSRFPRLVRDVSAKENKKIDLIVKGEEIELDRNVLDEIGEPLVHILRNSVDHGIEDPDTRMNSNKGENGTINLTARREKNMAVIEIKDDGAGIDTEKLRNKALQNELITEKEATELTRQQTLMLMFKPGLSTSDKVTEISGRGVGMDVVLTKIKKLGGNVKVESELGKGTVVELHLPLTLAIISSLLIRTGEEKYAIPLSSVVETIDLPKTDIKTIHGRKVVALRGEEVPLVHLSEVFQLPLSESDVYPVVITEEQERKIGFIVDEIIDQQQILIKNLSKLVKGVKGIAGATILGDGKVCLILDPSSIVSR